MNISLKTMHVLAAVLLVSFFSACKDFLDQEVPGKLPEDDFYKTDADANLAIIGAYDIMQSDYWNGAWTSMLMLKTMPSDESNAGGANEGDQPGYQELDKFTATSMNDKVSGAWQKCYMAIYRSNKIINKVNFDSEMARRIVGEAKFIRAYNYFDLVSLWGDVPLVLDDIDPSKYTEVGRTPKEQIYAQIETDLQEAIQALPVKSAFAPSDRFRASKGAAQTLLGKAYLYQEKWPDAVTQFDAVIASGEYDLAPSVAAVFARTGEFGIESIFEISYSNTADYGGNFPWSGTPESNIHIQLWGPRTDPPASYKKAPSDSLLGGWGMNLPRHKLYDAYMAEGDVDRRKSTVMSLEELKAAGGSFGTGVYDFDGVFQRKYGSFGSQSSQTPGVDQTLNYGTNWRYMRFADVLLMDAEAKYRAGDEGGANLALKRVRDRSGLSVVNAGGTALFDAIVRERQLELAFEGFRFQDLVRWGLAAQELGPLGFVTGKNELLPIPNNEVVTGKLEQNPGY